MKTIIKDPQIKKFCYYGFFKDLKFFEPYLIIYLSSIGLSYLQIGGLYAFREVIIYIFEIPSGIIADTYGKKLELMICFVFYMISFSLFFISSHIYMISLAMLFFALGEAFRSGTHKAMIFSYLEQKNWFEYKTFVYGRTRSFSLIGGALSSILSILFYLYTGNLKTLFAISILPYVLDFMLIASYPNSLNERHKVTFSLLDFAKENKRQLERFFKSKKLIILTLNSASLDAIFKSVGDYIQPILQLLIIATFKATDTTLVIYLGIVYAVMGLSSAVGSRNVYKLLERYSKVHLLDHFYKMMIFLFLGIALSTYFELQIILVLLFVISNILIDSRRPVFVDLIGDHLEKDQRATVLSIESQLKSFIVICVAPLSGAIADQFGFTSVFIFLSVLMLILMPIFSVTKLFNK
ncbi:MFS transporter [Fusibacter sp. 3D3]|uniref:MFS transporter n=1 Tax=Fusibacter sp. 3D3 TaxID=1048380 RepID=UPI000852C065|nr:MFS transporter [Fusibacter sp. 3D3]GAU76923.1 probable tetracycline resistance permease [Fusibacter sp. 3D3]